MKGWLAQPDASFSSAGALDEGQRRQTGRVDLRSQARGEHGAFRCTTTCTGGAVATGPGQSALWGEENVLAVQPGLDPVHVLVWKGLNKPAAGCLERVVWWATRAAQESERRLKNMMMMMMLC